MVFIEQKSIGLSETARKVARNIYPPVDIELNHNALALNYSRWDL